MVPERRAEAGLSDDVDDHRALQRTCRCLFTVDSVLKTIDQEVDGRGWLWHLLAVAYPEDTAQLTDLLPEHNEVFGYREADNQEPPLRVGRSHMRFDRAFLIAFNLLARLFGAIGILAGI